MPPKLVRWLVLAPITWVGALVLALLGIALAPVALVVDAFDRSNWRALRLLTLGWTFCVLEFLSLPAAFWVWVTSPFVAAGRRTERYQALLRWWLGSITRAIRWSLGFEFETDFPDTGTASLLVLSRHGGPGDALFLMNLLANEQGRHIRSVGKNRLLWDPFFDHVGNGAGYVFLGSGDGVDRILASSAMPARGAFISFPEGGNYSTRRRGAAIDRFQDAGDLERAGAAESLDHLLLPRTGGVHAAMQGAPDSTLVLIGHAGYGDIEGLGGIWRAIPQGRTVHLEARIVDRPDGWDDRGVVHDWLLACWTDMDRWIAKRRHQ